MIPARGDLLRAGATGGALVLAVLSKGDVLVLGVLLAVLVRRPLPVVAVVAALLAAAVRWRSLLLEDLAGAQAVLGASGVVDPPAGAASAWAAAVALVLAAPRREDAVRSSLVALALGASAAVVLAGAAPGGAVWARVLATAVGTGLALGVGELRRRPGADRWLDAGALAAALVAVLLALLAVDAPGEALQLRTDAATSATGFALAVAAGAVATMTLVLAARRGNRPLAQ